MDKVYASIDCGLSGGITFWKGTDITDIINMPTVNNKKEFLDMITIRELLELADIIIIEEQFSPQSKNQRGMKTNLVNFGMLQGVSLSLGKYVHVINATEWVTALGLSNRGRSPMLPKLTKADRALKANRLLGTTLNVKEDGKADSALIGFYYFKKNKLWG